jgi:uncharacterized Fe-S center protein
MELTIKSGGQIESLTLDAVIVADLLGEDAEQNVEVVQGWIKDLMIAHIRNRFGHRLITDYVRDHITEGS